MMSNQVNLLALQCTAFAYKIVIVRTSVGLAHARSPQLHHVRFGPCGAAGAEKNREIKSGSGAGTKLEWLTMSLFLSF